MSATEKKRRPRFTVEVDHEPIVAPTAGWAEIKHKSPLYGSPYRFDFMILRTETNKEEKLQYSVTQHIEIDDRDEEAVLEWLRDQDTVVDVAIVSRRRAFRPAPGTPSCTCIRSGAGQSSTSPAALRCRTSRRWPGTPASLRRDQRVHRRRRRGRRRSGGPPERARRRSCRRGRRGSAGTPSGRPQAPRSPPSAASKPQ